MEKVEDNQLILKIKESSCNESFKELTRRHSNLYYKICQKYLPTLRQMGVPADDVFNDMEYVFFRCLNSFNPDKKTKFSTWLGNYARYNCLNYINDYKRHNFYEENEFENIYDSTITNVQAPSDQDTTEVDYIFSILSKLKDRRIIKVYKMRYEDNGEKKATWSEIAKQMSISTQTAINLHTRGRKFLKNKLNSKEFQDMV